ncbi:hypothetical protein [Streptomyces sp. NPDC056948]|uniref:hypothetical protein n=1 Tax=Streptomyces sp. NPDC056948 TaxID=3345975 RepID=UPI003633BC6E
MRVGIEPASEETAMPETTPNSKGPAPAQYKPAATEPALVPADQVKPEDVAKLTIEYRDGQPVIVASGGTMIPGGITVVDKSGNAVAGYAARRDPVGFIFSAFNLGGTFDPDVVLPDKY